MKTNSKKARENIRAYILDNFDFSDYEGTEQEPKTFEEVCNFILKTFRKEKSRDYYSKVNESELFIEWCAGLASVLDTCYYYNRSAVDDLGRVLEENEQEKARFTESEAEACLTRRIYRELVRGSAQ